MKKLIAAALSLAVTGLVVAADAPAKPAAPAPKKEAPAAAKSKLMDPASLNEKAPDTFKVKFDTSKGSFTVAVTREWSPLGADRFYNLVKNGWFDNERFFRVVPGFVVQFGMSGDPALNQAWQGATIQDDPVKQSNKRGFVVFAKTNAPNSRGTQFFINYSDNAGLDPQGFSPFGQVTDGMETVVDKINSQYSQTPRQDLIQTQGNAYLEKEFPNLDYIKHASIVK